MAKEGEILRSYNAAHATTMRGRVDHIVYNILVRMMIEGEPLTEILSRRDDNC